MSGERESSFDHFEIEVSSKPSYQFYIRESKRCDAGGSAKPKAVSALSVPSSLQHPSSLVFEHWFVGKKSKCCKYETEEETELDMSRARLE